MRENRDAEPQREGETRASDPQPSQERGIPKGRREMGPEQSWRAWQGGGKEGNVWWDG